MNRPTRKGCDGREADRRRPKWQTAGDGNGPKRHGFEAPCTAGPDRRRAGRKPGRADMFERRSDLIRLLAVADAERIVTAADRLAITQPALSRVLARLEREIGGSLFERIPSGVRPTRLGAVAIEGARRILRETRDAEAAVAAELAGRTGRFRVTAPPLWMQTVIAPAVQAFHAAFPKVELKLRTASWREGVRQLADGRSDLHCGGPDTGEALPAHLRRERFLDVTGGIVAASGHPLHGGAVGPADLLGCPWIDFDGPAGAGGGSNRPSLAAVLDELRGLTGRPVRAVLRAGSAGLTLLAAGPWLAWLPLDLLDRLPRSPVSGAAPRIRATPLPRRLHRPALRRGPGAVQDARSGRARRRARAQRRASRIVNRWARGFVSRLALSSRLEPEPGAVLGLCWPSAQSAGCGFSCAADRGIETIELIVPDEILLLPGGQGIDTAFDEPGYRNPFGMQ